ncbi:MAG: hypothetical protein J6W28_02865 [Clostridia bacterium]|nr:hypothetical protein [Clostridia bacterium]
MFKLIKILGAGPNVPEPKSYTLTEDASLRYGTPAVLSGGKLTAVTSASTAAATHLVMADVSGKEALLSRITPDMIFEAPVIGSPSALKEETEYALSADGEGISATAVSGSVRGARLYDACGAAASGDSVLVYFANSL